MYETATIRCLDTTHLAASLKRPLAAATARSKKSKIHANWSDMMRDADFLRVNRVWTRSVVSLNSNERKEMIGRGLYPLNTIRALLAPSRPFLSLPGSGAPDQVTHARPLYQ
jgi:hypothetical protein